MPSKNTHSYYVRKNRYAPEGMMVLFTVLWLAVLFNLIHPRTYALPPEHALSYSSGELAVRHYPKGPTREILFFRGEDEQAYDCGIAAQGPCMTRTGAVLSGYKGQQVTFGWVKVSRRNDDRDVLSISVNGEKVWDYADSIKAYTEYRMSEQRNAPLNAALLTFLYVLSMYLLFWLRQLVEDVVEAEVREALRAERLQRERPTRAKNAGWWRE